MEKAIDRRLRRAGVLVLIGLGFEAASLFWNPPFSFFLFIIGSGLFVVLGILVFLYSLVSRGESAAADADAAGEGLRQAQGASLKP